MSGVGLHDVHPAELQRECTVVGRTRKGGIERAMPITSQGTKVPYEQSVKVVTKFVRLNGPAVGRISKNGPTPGNPYPSRAGRARTG